MERADNCLKKLVNWVVERLGAEEFTSLVIPRHALHPMYSFGGLATLMLVLQAITGVILLMFYVPAYGEANIAYESVRHVTEEVPYGFLIRGIHSYGASLMIILSILHFLRVYLTGAYAKPRELTYLVGIAAGLLVMITAIVGYSLRLDHIAAEAIRIGIFLVNQIPGGKLISPLLFGSGTFDEILSRYLAFHIGLTGLLFLILLLHFYAVHRHHISPPYDGSESEPVIPFFPNHALTEVSAAMVVIGALVMFTAAFPPELGYKFLLTEELPVGQPEWFVMSLYALIKTGIDPILAGMVIPGLGVLILVIMPWVDPLYSRHPRNRRLATTYLLIFAGEYVFFLIYGTITPGQQISLINALVIGLLIALAMGAIGVKLTSKPIPPKKGAPQREAGRSYAAEAFLRNFHWVSGLLLVAALALGGYAVTQHLQQLYQSAAFYLGGSAICLGWAAFAAKVGLYDAEYLVPSQNS